MTRTLALILSLLLLTARAEAAGTVTLVSNNVVRSWPNAQRIQLLWTSDAMGVVSGTTFTFVAGELKQVRIVPGTGGVAPDDNYDLTLVDAVGLNVLQDGGANRDTADATALVGLGYTLDGITTLEVVIANAGASKQGTLILLVVR